MSYFFLVLFFISVICLVVGLVKPTAFSRFIKGQVTRKRITLIFGLTIIGSFVLIGLTAEPQQKIESAVQPKTTEEIKETNEILSEIEDKIEEDTNLQAEKYEIVNVIDGDTVSLLINGKTIKIRLIGMDSPEYKACFYNEATTKAKELLLNKSVYLEKDVSQGELDKYGRTLGYIFLEDGSNFAEAMIRGGFAKEYTYNLPYKYQESFRKAEGVAKASKLGLWNPDNCVTTTSSEKVVETPTASMPTSTAVVDTAPSTASMSDSTTSANTTPAVIPMPVPATVPVSTEKPSGYSCSVSKNCGDMSSCEEAYFYLNTCGKGGLDRDKDGVPCETICAE